MSPDPRQTPARGDLAAEHLRGVVEAERYVAPRRMRVVLPVAPVTARPEGEAEMTSQLLWGEPFDAYETDGMWAWGQGALDGYVGYVPRTCLELAADLGPAPTHRIAALTAPVYPVADFKARPGGQLPYGAQVSVLSMEAGNQAKYASIAPGGHVAAAHLAPLEAPVADWVAEAERFLGVPYLWGGRSPFGIDCSGLVQVALAAAGRACPRDTDQQEAALAGRWPAGARLTRGDLVFWKGHVGIMQSGTRMLHANIHHMAVASEPLAEARARIGASGGGEVTARARLDAGAGAG